VVTKEAFDPKTGRTRELAATPLRLARNGAFLEARIEPLPLPTKLTAKVSFGTGDKESRFDFTFPSYSIDAPPPPSSTMRTPAAPIAPVAPIAPIAPIAPASLLADLKARNDEIASLLKSGTLRAIYVPALQAKDLALELQARQPAASRDVVEASIKQIVLAAYQLDTYGDLGNAEEAEVAFRAMTAAIARLESLVSEPRP
jgi:hypothetical protein